MMSGGWSTPISGGAAPGFGTAATGGTAGGTWGTASGATGSAPSFSSGGAAGVVVRPSTAPDVLAVGALVASALIAIVTAPEAILGRVPVLSALAGPLAAGPGAALLASSASVVVASVFGYLLTPFAVVAALAWARSTGLTKLDDPWFDRIRLRAQMRRMQALALLAFVLAVPHVFIIARAIQAALGLGA
jgi:hypothetical protein